MIEITVCLILHTNVFSDSKIGPIFLLRSRDFAWIFGQFSKTFNPKFITNNFNNQLIRFHSIIKLSSRISSGFLALVVAVSDFFGLVAGTLWG